MSKAGRFWRRVTGADTRAAVRRMRKDLMLVRGDLAELRREFGVTLAKLGVAVGLARKASHIGRNTKCPCGSGKKLKNCCLGKDGA